MKSKIRKTINLQDLIYPIFVKEGSRRKESVSSMPGVFRFSLNKLHLEMEELSKLGIRKILIFGIPDKKDWKGSAAYRENNIVSEAIKNIKLSFPDVTIFTDVCLCAYTKHGHCGIIRKGFKKINKRDTLKVLSEIAILHAKAGADYVAPSAMAEGQVRAIRNFLDKNGFVHTKIMGYSAKFASYAYGPFREIADSAPRFGNRKAYQLDYTDRKKALDKIKKDIHDKADIVMVKPALWYLDIIKEAKEKLDYPLAAYNVSGEYAMVKAGVGAGFWDEKDMVFEIMHSIKRAGADSIITYHAKDIARWLK